MRSITVLSDRADDVVIRSPRQRSNMLRVSSLAELPAVLARLPDGEEPTLLDLAGHSTRDAKLLRLGETVIDMLRPSVRRVFEQLVASGELDRLLVVAVRLLGCETALEPAGQLTIKLLATTLGRSVFGARCMLMASHYNEHGFDPCFSTLLLEAAQLPSPPRRLP
ncbi:MAG: hypothetical protein SFX73_32045 [Kofleriaceae bacterium]|nr:hypothetical protein [Kofleriaceae bacterium]